MVERCVASAFAKPTVRRVARPTRSGTLEGSRFGTWLDTWRIQSPASGTAKRRFKQAAPENDPARCSWLTHSDGIIKIANLSDVRGSRLLCRSAGHHVIVLDSGGRSREHQSGSPPGVATPTASQARQALHGLRPGRYDPKKIQPPVSAGYEGLLFPPEQSEKIFVGILPQISGHFK
jgi:hypothetical protein